jgi:hypothetical protein
MIGSGRIKAPHFGHNVANGSTGSEAGAGDGTNGVGASAESSAHARNNFVPTLASASRL